MVIFALAMIAAQAPANSPAPDPRIAIAESAIRQTLKDPDSARFNWPYGFTAGTYREELGRKHPGTIICGTVNAKNGYGGYTGEYAAIAVLDGDTVSITDIDSPGQWSPHAGWVADQCSKLGEPVL